MTFRGVIPCEESVTSLCLFTQFETRTSFMPECLSNWSRLIFLLKHSEHADGKLPARTNKHKVHPVSDDYDTLFCTLLFYPDVEPCRHTLHVKHKKLQTKHIFWSPCPLHPIRTENQIKRRPCLSRLTSNNNFYSSFKVLVVTQK